MTIIDTTITENDIGILLEALEAWELKDSASDMMADVFDLMFAGKTPAEREAVQVKLEHRRTETRQRVDQRKRRSVLLRAKLILYRDQLVIEQASETRP